MHKLSKLASALLNRVGLPMFASVADQPAKLADDFINQLGFSQARVSIDTVGTVYVMTDALDLSGTVVVNLPNAAATSLAGPYNTPFLTLPSCSRTSSVNSRLRSGVGMAAP